MTKLTSKTEELISEMRYLKTQLEKKAAELRKELAPTQKELDFVYEASVQLYDDLDATDFLSHDVHVCELVLDTRARIKMTDDRDCLPADVLRIETRIFPSDAEIFRAGFAYQKRGFNVCIDTATIDCFEFGPDELVQTQAIALGSIACKA